MNKPVLVIMATGMGNRYGVTCRQDKPAAVAAIAEKTKAGLYPDRLWEA